MNQPEPSAAIKDYLPYTLPFFVFAGFTYAIPLMDLAAGPAYAIKTAAVLLVLIPCYAKVRHEIKPFMDKNAVMAGMTAFVLWIWLEGWYPLLGIPGGFHLAEDRSLSLAWISVRLLGATLVVPVMEEMFWRSFALRFLMDKNFKQVPLGSFSWFSFIAVSLAFGLEHHRWLPGILTGMLYALVLYQKKNLFSPILAHAVTNFLLGVYVIANQAWQFW